MSYLVLNLNSFDEIIIESEESKTVQGTPVFNKISYQKIGKRDIWMMNQAHDGLKGKWDRLAIIVDTNLGFGRVKFYQLSPGELKWSKDIKQVPYNVPCFICHSNGPRAIRPNFESSKVSYNLKTKVKIFLWNMKIKSYGKLVEYADQIDIDKKQKPPFRTRGKYENEVLKVGTCIKCHKESGFLARGSLTRQHKTTIKHMLKKGYMPPLGFSLSSKEEKELEVFLKGF
jgi:mono/diheme cytochrome c family protein